MYILGINLSHHASLCLMKDGETIYYLEDDRWSGEKEAHWSLEDEISSFRDLLKYTHHIDHIIFTSFCRGERYKWIEYEGVVVSDRQLIEKIKKDLNHWNITYDNCHYFIEHHLYHACSAFYGSGFDEAAALVMDGTGAYVRDYITNRECESMYHFSEVGKVELLNSVYTPSNFLYYDPPFKIESNKTLSSTLSCGSIFAAIQVATQIYSPGKLMGLSPYGDLSVSEEDGEWYTYDENTNHWYSNNETILNSIRKLLNNPYLSTHDRNTIRESTLNQKSNLAKKVQHETKEHTIHLIELLLDKVDTKNIVLSGGYFLNCVNNYEYIKKFPEINFYIDPMAHDGGTSYGGVKYVWHHLLNKKEKYPLETLFLGG